MLEDPNTTPPADPQAGNAGTTPQPQAGTNPPEPQAGEGSETTISLDEARKLRSESANLRKRLKEFEALNTELKTFKERIDAEKLSDDEKRAAAQKKLEQQLAEQQSTHNALLAELQESRIANEVLKHASRLNIVDPDAAVKLLDGSKIEYDEAGQPTNIDALLKDMIKQRSWLAGKPQAQTSGGATNPSRSTSSGPTELTLEYVTRLMQNPEEFRQLPEPRQREISTWIGKNYTRFR